MEEGAEPSAEGGKPPVSSEELEELMGKAEGEETEEFVDLQLQEAIRILKAIRAIGGGSHAMLRASTSG
jgi:hypothetical protein